MRIVLIISYVLVGLGFYGHMPRLQPDVPKPTLIGGSVFWPVLLGFIIAEEISNIKNSKRTNRSGL